MVPISSRSNHKAGGSWFRFTSAMHTTKLEEGIGGASVSASLRYCFSTTYNIIQFCPFLGSLCIYSLNSAGHDSRNIGSLLWSHSPDRRSVVDSLNVYVHYLIQSPLLYYILNQLDSTIKTLINNKQKLKNNSLSLHQFPSKSIKFGTKT